MYVPNSALTPFHDRSPWVMFPRSFQTLGYESTLICGAFTGTRPAGLRILESFQVVKNPRKGGKARSLFEPLLVFGEIRRQRPDTVMVGPLRSSLFSFLPLVLLYRLFTERGRTRRTTFVLKADWGLDATGLSRLEAALSRTLLVVSTYVLDLVTFETSCGLGRARRLSGIRPDRTARVPLAFPQGTMERLPYSASPRTPVVLCVARITRMKGQDVLLKAFFRIAGRFPEWSIHLVGPVEDPGFQDELRGMAAQGGWTDRVVMSGFVEESELEREFSAASVFCLPSVHSENAGQVQYEATARGLPVITTDVVCAADAEEMGWIVTRAGSVDDLAKKLEGLLEDEGRRAGTADRAQTRQGTYLDLVQSHPFPAPRRAREVDI